MSFAQSLRLAHLIKQKQDPESSPLSDNFGLFLTITNITLRFTLLVNFNCFHYLINSLWQVVGLNLNSMKFELEFFEEFVTKECRQNAKLNSSIIDYQKKVDVIEAESERIKKCFVRHLFEAKNDRKMEQFIQQHQAHIIRLADKVATIIDQESVHNLKNITSGTSRLNLCKVLLLVFEDLLNYIEVHFTKYFDQDQKIPDAYIFISVKEFEENLNTLQNLFKAKQVEEKLSLIVLYPIIQFTDIPQKQFFSFRRLIYLKHLVKSLFKILEDNNQQNYSQTIYEFLIYLNFNNHHLVQYSVSKVQTELERMDSLQAQLEHLSLLIKNLSQTQVKPDYALKPGRPLIKNLLLNWMDDEVHYIEKRRQLSLMMPPGAQNNVTLGDTKIKTTLSVSQIAYMIRLFKEEGIIVNNNKAELFRFFSKHFSSAHNENISTESFRSKYFANDESSVRHVKDVLNKLLLRLKQQE